MTDRVKYTGIRKHGALLHFLQHYRKRVWPKFKILSYKIMKGIIFLTYQKNQEKLYEKYKYKKAEILCKFTMCIEVLKKLMTVVLRKEECE